MFGRVTGCKLCRGLAVAAASFVVTPLNDNTIDRSEYNNNNDDKNSKCEDNNNKNLSQTLLTETIDAELHGIEEDLKNWFLTRKINMERNKSMHALLQKHNFVGVSINNSTLPESQRAMWGDLVYGVPKLEDSLSVDAREMKVDMYTKMLRDAADLENPVRIPGIKYLRCLQQNVTEAHDNRHARCKSLFEAFDEERKKLINRQAETLESALITQNVEDLRAKSLFERRLILLDVLKNCKKQ